MSIMLKTSSSKTSFTSQSSPEAEPLLRTEVRAVGGSL